MLLKTTPPTYSFKTRLFLCFLSVVLVCMLWAIGYFFIDYKQKRLSDFSLKLNNVQIEYFKSVNALDRFMIAGFHNPAFYKDGHEQNIDQFLDLQKEIAARLTGLKDDAAYNKLELKDPLNTLMQLSNSISGAGTQLRYFYYRKGFVDFGTEGDMRKHAHWIEVRGQIGKVDILQLRRHEKDYIMRGKQLYANEYFGTIDSLIKLRPSKDSTFLELSNYENSFRDLVKYSVALGTFDKVGVVPTTQSYISAFNQVFVATSSVSVKEVSRLQARFTLLLMIITIVFIISALILCYHLSKFLTADIKELNHRMDTFMNADFKNMIVSEPENNIIPRSLEVQRLFDNFAALKSSLLNYINNLNLQTDDLQCLNEELQAQSEELKSLNEELEEQRELEYEANQRYNFVTKATSDAIWDWDLAKDTLIWGEGFNAIFGHNIKQIQSAHDSLRSFLHPEDAERVMSGIREIIVSKNSIWKAEYRYLKADGSYAYVVDRGFVIRNDHGEAIRMVGAMHDSTANKKAELELKLFADDLFSRNKELHQFGYVVSHNLRSPIANIMGITDLLELDKDDPETLEKCTTNLKTAVHSLDSVVKDLSKILTITDGSVELTKEKVDLTLILNNIKTDLEEVLNHSKAKIEIPADSHFLFSHKAYLYSIFYNLISNAIKYKSKHSPEILISISTTPEFLVISVADNGIGIDLNKYAHDLFKPYKRFNLGVEGKGLGLFLVKSHIESLNGTITIDSEIGAGTTFTIKLPFRANQDYSNN